MAERNDPVHGWGADWWGAWSWRKPSRGEHFRRCSFCGSIHPDDLLAEKGWRADWADLKYGFPHKFYVAIANRDPERMYVLASANFRPALERSWLRVPGELTPEQLAALERDGYVGDYRPDYVQFGTHEHHFGKFYTVHLADPSIAPETKAAVEQISGVEFEFFPGHKLTWRPV